MKIGQPHPGAVHPASTSSPGTAKSGAGTAASPDKQGPGVAVSLSAQTRELSAAQRSTSDIDVNKVKAVAEAIEKGTYKVNPEAIADKLLANAQEMLQNRSH